MRLLLLGLGGCATLHHVQVGEIDATNDLGARRFEIEVRLGERDGLDRASLYLAGMTSPFVMGPRTGAPVAREPLTGDLTYKLYEACPSGEITGVTSRRESFASFDERSETIRITGYCLVH